MRNLIIGVLGALTLSLSVLSFAGESEDKVVEIYKTEFTRYAPATCDGTNSTGYIFEGQLNGASYFVREMIMWDKVRFLAVTDSMAEEYFYIVTAEGEVTETHHADWDAKLLDASPGFFYLLHPNMGSNDCKFGSII